MIRTFALVFAALASLLSTEQIVHAAQAGAAATCESAIGFPVAARGEGEVSSPAVLIPEGATFSKAEIWMSLTSPQRNYLQCLMGQECLLSDIRTGQTYTVGVSGLKQNADEDGATLFSVSIKPHSIFAGQARLIVQYQIHGRLCQSAGELVVGNASSAVLRVLVPPGAHIDGVVTKGRELIQRFRWRTCDDQSQKISSWCWGESSRYVGELKFKTEDYLDLIDETAGEESTCLNFSPSPRNCRTEVKYKP